MGTPEFMQRVTPAETPEQAQARLMSVYAQQQQAINPYRALMAEKLDLWQRAVNGESLTETEKILLGIQAKEDPEKLKLFKMLFPDSDLPIPTPNLTPKPKYNSKTEKLMWSPSQQKYFVVPK
jgi:hypothetical protein